MKAIKNAPGYSINENNEIVNDKTGKTITENNGNVRLMIDGKRKSFKVSTLIEENGKAPVAPAEYKKPGSAAAPKKTEDKAADTTPKKKVVIKKKATVKPKAKAEKKKKEKTESPAELIKKGIYPYKIKDLDKIKEMIDSLEIGDKVQFTDYQSKRKVTGTVVSHTKFSDHYPGVRVVTGKGKDKKSRILSYLNIKKK